MSLIFLLEGKRTMISLGGTFSHVGKISQSPLEDFTLTGLPSIKCLILLAIISPCLSKESPESKASKYSFKLVDGLIEKS